MVKFLNTTQARGEIESILTNAHTTDIVMISPYIKIKDDLLKRLVDAGQRGVKIVMVCREDKLAPEERAKLQHTPNLELYFNQRVHAKCFYNRETMVIGSLDLYDSAAGSDFEMAVLLSSNETAFQDARSEAELIIRESREARAVEPTLKISVLDKAGHETIARRETSRFETQIPHPISKFLDSLTRESNSKGHCLHCGTSIALNRGTPYCPTCYRTSYGSDSSEEKYCHQCGRPARTSIRHPMCPVCSKS